MSSEVAVEMYGGRWKRYPAYKDSMVDWLGDVPDGWDVKALKSICYMKGRIGWQGLKQSEFTTEGPYLITGMNFKDGVIRWEEVYHITEERYNEAPEIQLKVDDVLMTKDGTIGKILYVGFLPDKASLNSHLLVLRPFKDSVLPKYLYYLLKSEHFKVHIEINKTGTTFFGITQEAVGIFKMIIPSKNEQRTITSFLDRETERIDTLIEKKEQQVELLQEKRAALISHAVTKGLNPDVKMKDSGVEWLGEVPEEWKLAKLKRVSNKITDGEHISPEFTVEGMPFLSAKDVRYRKINIDVDKYVSWEDGVGFRKRCNPDRGDILIVSRGATIGRIGLVETDKLFCLLGSVILIKPNLSKIQPVFLYYLLNQSKVQERFLLTSQSSAQQAIYIINLSELAISIPPISEQNAIAAFLDRETEHMDTLTTKVRESISKLREYRTALISAAVTGKIDVREDLVS